MVVLFILFIAIFFRGKYLQWLYLLCYTTSVAKKSHIWLSLQVPNSFYVYHIKDAPRGAQRCGQRCNCYAIASRVRVRKRTPIKRAVAGREVYGRKKPKVEERT